MKKIIILLLSFITNLNVWADQSGSIGSNLIWTLSTDSVLTISGSGDMEMVEDWQYGSGDGSMLFWFNDYDRFWSRDKVKKIIIEEGITSISLAAFFNCSNLETVSLPISLKTIDDYVFYYCSSLREIYIPSSVNSIGKGAFASCDMLEKIAIDEANPIYSSCGNCNAIIEKTSNKLIAGCKNTVIPNYVTEICDDAFHGCIGLKSITIPTGVISIGMRSFRDCKSLTSIALPNSLKNIGYGAFSCCDKLGILNIPSSVESIGSYAFERCNFESIAIPSSVKRMGCGLFVYCSGNLIINCNIPDFSKECWYYGYDSECGPFCNSKLSNIIIGNEVTHIGDHAFDSCDSLTSVTISNSVTNIGKSAFSGCRSLTSVTIPNSVTNIGESAFYGCIYEA